MSGEGRLVAGQMLAFRRLRNEDEETLRRWLHAPHVREWWGDPDRELSEALSHIALHDATAYIITLNGEESGYIHAYDAAEDDYFADRPAGAKGIDLYLGETECLGRGIGSGVIGAFAGHLLSHGVPEVVTDPDPANGRAVAAYKKAGFKPYHVHRDEQHGHLILMSRTPEDTLP